MATISINVMRNAIQKQYNYSPAWVDRVNRMRDNQVIAIYRNLEKKGKLGKTSHNRKEVKPENTPFMQYNIFDYVNEDGDFVVSSK